MGPLEAGAASPAGKWQHVAIVKTPQAITFFLNGVVVASASGSASLAASTLPLRVGLGFRADQENRTFRGCIDEFRVWNTAVTKFDLELSKEESGCLLRSRCGSNGTASRQRGPMSRSAGSSPFRQN